MYLEQNISIGSIHASFHKFHNVSICQSKKKANNVDFSINVSMGHYDNVWSVPQISEEMSLFSQLSLY